MEVKSFKQGEIAIFQVAGEINISTSPDFKKNFEQMPAQKIIIDLERVGYVDSSGLATLVEILKKSGRLHEFKINPQHFMALVSREISRALHDLILEGIQYEKIAGNYWEMSRIEEEAEKDITHYLSNLYEVQHKEKSLFDAIEYESEVEKKFAQDLDSNEYVKLFVKLPAWFKIDTPIGTYNPDWAFVTEREEKLYFVSRVHQS